MIVRWIEEVIDEAAQALPEVLDWFQGEA